MSGALSQGRFVEKVRAGLPRGQTLPADAWEKRHRALFLLLCAHALILPIFGALHGYGLLHSLAHSVALPLIVGVAYLLRRRRQAAATVVALGLITSSALLVHLSDGVIEAHFHFFVMIVVLALYEDWLPFLLAAAYVVIHHGLTGAIAPHEVFNHPDAIAHPWKWAAIHGAFVTAAGIASVVAWRLNEGARSETREAYRQTRQILETAHDAFIAIDEAGLITDCNPQAEATFGWTREEMLGGELAQLIIPEAYREAHRRGIAHFLASGEGPVLGKRLELTALHRDGREFPIELTISALRTQDGYTFNAFLRDVSERKAAEELLERQRRQLIEAQSVGQLGSWEWDITTDAVEWSPELFRIFGIEPRSDPLRFEDFLGAVHPDDRPRVEAVLSAALESGESFSFEHRIVHPDGAVRVAHARGEVILREDRAPVRMLGTGQDVTERKAAEETRSRLAALVDCSEDAIFAKTLAGIIESWNRGAQELFGYTAEETIGQPIAMLVPPERQEELREILAQVGRGERVEPLETVRLAKDGRQIDVSLRISLLHSPDGELVGSSSICHDISRRKQLEAQLRRSSRHFELLRDLAITSGFDGYFKSANPALTQILGWSVDEFLARPFIDMVHPDDRAATLAEVEKLAEGQTTFNFTNRYEARDGSYRWLDWNAIVPPDEELMYAAARDITERTLMEQALREAEQRFRTAFDGAPIGSA